MVLKIRSESSDNPHFYLYSLSTPRFIKPYRDPVYKMHLISVRFYEIGDIRKYYGDCISIIWMIFLQCEIEALGVRFQWDPL